MLPGKEREAIDLFSHFPELTRREEEEETYRYFPSTKTLCSSSGKQSKKDWKTFWRRRFYFILFSSNPFSFLLWLASPPFFSISCLSSLSIVSLTDISICRQVLFIREKRGWRVGGKSNPLKREWGMKVERGEEGGWKVSSFWGEGCFGKAFANIPLHSSLKTRILLGVIGEFPSLFCWMGDESNFSVDQKRGWKVLPRCYYTHRHRRRNHNTSPHPTPPISPTPTDTWSAFTLLVLGENRVGGGAGES